MGDEFIGEVVDHGPDCSRRLPVDRNAGHQHADPDPAARSCLVIGHHPDAPGAFGELMVVSEMMSREGALKAQGLRMMLSRSSTHSRWEKSTFAVLASGRVSCRSSSAPEPSGLSTVAALAARGVGPIVVSDYSDDRLAYAKKFGADVLVNPANRDPYDVWRETFRTNGIQTPQVVFECVGKNGLLQSIVDSCEFMARVYVAGGWYDAGTINCPDAPTRA